MTTKTPTTPNFWGVNRNTYLRTIPYRSHGKIELLGLQCVVARCLDPKALANKACDWVILDIESGMSIGHWHHSKAYALADVPVFLAAQSPRGIKYALEARLETLTRMARAAAKQAKAEASVKGGRRQT